MPTTVERWRPVGRCLAVGCAFAVLLATGGCGGTVPESSGTAPTTQTTETAAVLEPGGTTSTKAEPTVTLAGAIGRIEQGFFGDTLYTYSVEAEVGLVYGLADAKGAVLVEAQYREIEPLTPDRFIVQDQATEGKVGLIDRQNRVIFPLNATDLEMNPVERDAEGVYTGTVLIVKNLWNLGADSSYYLIDMDGNLVDTETWEVLQFYEPEPGMVLAVRNNMTYALNYQGEIELRFPEDVLVVEELCDGTLEKTAVAYGTLLRYGIQSKTGTTILPPEYEWILVIGQDRFVASRTGLGENRCMLYDEAGRPLTSREYHAIRFYQQTDGSYSKGAIASWADTAGNVREWYLLSRDGRELNQQPYDTMRFVDAETIEVQSQEETFRIDLDGNRR